MKELNEGLESYDDIVFDEVPLSEEDLTEDEEKILDELGLHGESRRKFLGQVGASAFGVLAAQVLANQEALAAGGGFKSAAPASVENVVKVAMKINGDMKSLEVDSRMTLLDALRERLALTGSKKGCDQGQCGTCTVIVDGNRVLSCLTLTATCEGKEITTIEGIANGDKLHPIQESFIKYDAFQCGYCTPGQICSSVALLEEAKNGEVSYVSEDVRSKARNLTLSDDDIRERMSGNICRCGAYPNIIKAIKEVHTGKPTGHSWNFAKREETRDETV
jgi:xanthine dehydrogenase YagT iron-sulfur-binding subunit